MTENYIKPQDVSPQDAQKVLNFLNSVQSAEEIDKAVEIPDERDVGIRVGQRILDRRQVLGSFTNLQQIADIPQIGPERFTEIVTTLREKGEGGDVVATDNFTREIQSYKYIVSTMFKGVHHLIFFIDSTGVYHYFFVREPPYEVYLNQGSVRVHIDSATFSVLIDMLRNEKPVFIHLTTASDGTYRCDISTNKEPVGEEEAQ